MKATFKVLGIIALLAIIAFSMAACDDGSDGGVPVTGVTLNKSSISLTVGETATLTATVTPNNATNKAVTWITSNPAAATVANGVVTAVGTGSATIRATTAYGGKTAACSVTVTDGVPVTGVTLNKSSISLTVGKTETLTATITPNNATNKAVTWSTSNAAAATVANGVVTAVAAGSVTITVSTADGDKTAACSITVTKAGPASTFILTDIPSQYNGVYMYVYTDEHKPSFYCYTNYWIYYPEIKDGRASAALFEDFKVSKSPPFTGTKVINVSVQFTYGTRADQISPVIVMLKFSNVSFTNGGATVSAKDARWYTASGSPINPPTE